jgi:DNA-directed RNA polymerase sigma subunit (sigma70/sigma32)
VNNLRRRLFLFLEQEFNQGMLDKHDVQILSLSLGLEDGKCLTLKEISERMHHSSEYIRLRQHFILQRKVKQPLFFLVLEHYARYVKLPRGILYQLKLKQEEE